MFKIVKRIIDWCGEYKGRLYLGFALTFILHFVTILPIMVASTTFGMLINDYKGYGVFDKSLIVKSFIIVLILVLLKFVLTYIKARLQEPISYEMVAKNRLEVGEALKRVSLGYFSEMNTGNILNSITTGLNALEKMGIRVIDTFVGGYINFIVIFIYMLIISPKLALICIISVLLSFIFLLLISNSSLKNANIEAKSNEELTKATLEYARGLAMVKSFAQSGVSFANMKKAIEDSKDIHLKVEWDFMPYSVLHLFSLKIGSIILAFVVVLLGLNNQLDIITTLSILMLSFMIFGSIEPISDSAHLLNIIDDAMNKVDSIKNQHCLDSDGQDIKLEHYDIEFEHVNFGYSNKQVLHDVTFKIKEKSINAIVGPSGSGKSTICSLLARFYDVDRGKIIVGGHNIKELTCDSLLKNISMVFQNVYLFNDTIRNNICFGKPDATEEEMIEASKKACCHDFIMALPNGYDTVLNEGGNSLSGGEKQRISIARAILKDAPIIILDEATASIDPENEQYIQKAISELTKDKTIITIAHRLKTIENANQIIVLDQGQVVQIGKHAELINEDGKYQQFIKARELAEGWHII